MGYKRKFLSSEGLVSTVTRCFRREKFPSCPRSTISWQDCLMSGLAVFGLKFPSLLQFEERTRSDSAVKRNLRILYDVDNIPSDTCFRERLDILSPHQLRRPFKQILAHLQRGKALEAYQYLGGHYIVSIDGTGQYSSTQVSCENCCTKKHRNGTVSYYHQMLGAAIVHPHQRIVIPLAPEPIVKGDGDTKNDCERNASKRLLTDFRREHPHLKTLIVEDGLASNYPHLSLIDSLKMKYVIGVKPGDHTYLFDWIRDLKAHEYRQVDENGTEHDFKYYHDIPLNDAHYEYRVNVIDYTETKKNGRQQHFSWVTNFTPSDENVYELMRAGRARWRIESVPQKHKRRFKWK